MRFNPLILVLLVIFVPDVMLSATWADEIPLYVMGDVSYLIQNYEMVKNIIAHPSVNLIIETGIGITVIIAAYRSRDGDVQSFGLALLAPLTFIGLFFTPFATVHITDIRVDNGYIDHTLSAHGGYDKVEGVPWAIAFLPASFMLITNTFVDIIDDSNPDVHAANKFSSTGFQTMALEVQSQVKKRSCGSGTDTNSTKYMYNIDTYIDKCIIGRGMRYYQNHAYVEAPDEVFPDNLNPANFPFLFGDEKVTYIDSENVEQPDIKCSKAYTDLVFTDSSKVVEQCKDSIDFGHPATDLTSATASEAFRQQIGDTANKIGTIQKMKATTVVARMVEKARHLDAVDLAVDTAMNTTIAGMRTEGPAKLAWIAKVLPDAIFLLAGIFIAAFPLLIIVQSFMGVGAFKAVANYFMGFFALYFNLVGLALVQNIMSYYIAQKAQNAIVNQAGMPFSARYLDEFLIQQADMTGLAGIIGAACVMGLTPLIFYGESKGLTAAIGAATGAFRGGVDATSQDMVKQGSLEAAIDQELLEERNGMTDAQASDWLSQGGFKKRANMSALDTYNQIQRGYSQIGSGITASDLVHSGNVGDFIKGNRLASTQQTMKSVGMGNAMDGNVMGSNDSIIEAAEVSMQDGQVMGKSVLATHDLREKGGFDTGAIGAGQALQQYAKDMGTSYIGKDLSQQLQDESNLKDNISDASYAQKVANENLQNAKDAQSNLENAITSQKEAFSDLNEVKNNPDSTDFEKLTAQSSFDYARSNALDAQTQVDNAGSISNAEINVGNAKLDLENANSHLEEFNKAGNPLVEGITSSLVANAVNSSVQQIASGEGLKESGLFDKGTGMVLNNSEVDKYMKGVATQTLQKTNQTVGFGDTVDMDSAAKVSLQDGKIQGSMTNEIDKLRDDIKGWNTNDIASGQALGQVGKEMSAIGTNKAINEIDGIQNFMDGNLHYGQKGAKATIGEGELRADIIAGGQKHKDKNGKEKTTTLDDVMAGVKTSVKAKGDAEFEEANRLKNEFGVNLDQNGGYKTTTTELKDDVSKELKNLMSNPFENQDKIDALRADKSNYKQEEKNISHSDMLSNESSGKLAGRMGNAVAFDELNKYGDASDITSSNAQYGALSQALTTKDKIDTQGGIDNAVKIDRVEAQQKAATQMDVLDKNLKATGEADGGLKTPIENLTKAIDTLASKDGTMAAGKTAGDLRTVDTLDRVNKNNGGYIGAMAELSETKAASMMGDVNKSKLFNKDNMEDYVNSLKEKGFTREQVKDFYIDGDQSKGVKTGSDAIATFSEKSGGNMTGMNGVAIGDSKVDAVFSKDGVRVSKIDQSESFDKSKSHKEGFSAQFGSAGQVALKFANGDENLAKNMLQSSEMTEYLASKKGIIGMGSGAVNRARDEFNDTFGTDFGEEHSTLGTIGDAATLLGIGYGAKKARGAYLDRKKRIKSSDSAPSTTTDANTRTVNTNPESMSNSSQKTNLAGGQTQSHSEYKESIAEKEKQLNRKNKISSFKNVLSSPKSIIGGSMMLAASYADEDSVVGQVANSKTAQYAAAGASGYMIPGPVGWVAGTVGTVGGAIYGAYQDVKSGYAQNAYNSISSSASSAITSVGNTVSSGWNTITQPTTNGANPMVLNPRPQPTANVPSFSNAPGLGAYGSNQSTSFIPSNTGGENLTFTSNQNTFQTNTNDSSVGYLEDLNSSGADTARSMEDLQVTMMDYLDSQSQGKR